ncbi:MAG: hypothetical protein AMXMBFR33_68460 [Candidatus Xenobia bacterium]
MSFAGPDRESLRLEQDHRRELNWKRWGPYLAERQWATVREDYSADGDTWGHFPHDHARSRVYRWGEDGLLGFCDRQARLCFSLALWNGRDPILKERLYGLTGPEGNHGEDVKECYYYLDATPTHSFMRALYKYPQREFPYQDLSRSRGRHEPEHELEDTGAFQDNRYFDVFVEYAKAGPDDLLIRFRVYNRGPRQAPVWLLPQLWFRNTWSWGRQGEGYSPRPRLWNQGGSIAFEHGELGSGRLEPDLSPTGEPPELLFTENESNRELLWGVKNRHSYVKDAFHRYLVGGEQEAVNPRQEGTKAAVLYSLNVPAGGSAEVRLRLTIGESGEAFGPSFASAFLEREREADLFYERRLPPGLSAEERNVARQAYAGLLWSKQFYHYAVEPWLGGDPTEPSPPAERLTGRNNEWGHLYNRDVISMPDKWEYPWYAAWDLAFQVVPLARVDPHFAKQQLLLLLREWYMHPNGQIPAYEFNFSDVNPPVHAWAALRIYRSQPEPDREFLERVFHKLLLNFTWWVNRTDQDGNNIFGGGFLGLDNVGVLDRSRFPTELGRLEQSDATSWVAFFCLRMLTIALELARTNQSYEDIASKFFEHFVAITHAMNRLDVWDEQDAFYYDVVRTETGPVPLKARSLVGLMPLIAVEVLKRSELEKLPGFWKRLQWFLGNSGELARHVRQDHDQLLLSLVPPERLPRLMDRMFDEEEFLSPYGLRSLSRAHAHQPYAVELGGVEFRVDYEPGESQTGLFGGNSNWRGPVWFPVNYLLAEALDRMDRFYRAGYASRAVDLWSRLSKLFLPGPDGKRPCHGENSRYAAEWSDLILFHEYFHGDTGRGLGASHQTGWTALVASCLERVARVRALTGSVS